MMDEPSEAMIEAGLSTPVPGVEGAVFADALSAADLTAIYLAMQQASQANGDGVQKLKDDE